MEEVIASARISQHIHKFHWYEISHTIAEVNPELHKVIEELEPGDHFTLYVIRYPFGKKIVNQGVLQVPNDQDQFVNISDSSVPYELRKELTYSSVPLGLTLNKSNEVYVETRDRVIPLTLIRPGNLIGLLETVGSIYGSAFSSLQSISAGARSIFMLPKISDANMHKRLCRYHNVSIHPPQSLWEHRDIFAQIARSDSAGEWYSDVLFFGKEWVTERVNHLAWHKLIHQLYLNVWKQYEYLRCKSMVDFGWEVFTSHTTAHGFKAKPHTMNTIKHLTLIASGVAPGFCPAGRSEKAAPIKALEEAYVNAYGLKDYLPIIMHLNHTVDSHSKESRYYSLSMPTLPETACTIKPTVNIISEIRDLKNVIDCFDTHLNLLTDIKFTPLNSCQLSYFHTSEDLDSNIKPTRLIPEEDSSLLETYGNYDNREFPSSSPFMRGCIKITD